MISEQELEALLQQLNHQKRSWIQVDLQARILLLQQCLHLISVHAQDWVAQACQIKKIDPHSNRAAEEWLTGPMSLCRYLRLLMDSLQQIQRPLPTATAVNGQATVGVFPSSFLESLLWPGFRAEIWIDPKYPPSRGESYRHFPDQGAVTLVLGAGNVTSLAPCDALHQLLVEQSVTLLKLNPCLQELESCFKTILHPLIQAGFLAIVAGDADRGQWLSQHPLVERIHLTGSSKTYAMLQRQVSAFSPPKPITAELGCVTPILVVPGAWTAQDLSYQARQIASALTYNGGFNCNTPQVLITSREWPLRQELLNRLQQELEQISPYHPLIPGAEIRQQQFRAHYPQAQALGPVSSGGLPWVLIRDLSPSPEEFALQTEAFCGVLAEVSLPTRNASSFLQEAVAFVNDHVWGTLSCMILIDPQTSRSLKSQLQQAIADLRYGGIAINCWSAVLYSLMTTTWGAFPREDPRNEISSGNGWVHNTFLLDHPQKSIVYAPWRLPFTPPWFSDHRQARTMAQLLTDFEAQPGWLKLPSIWTLALKG
ncbi:MAG: aldehyde dehydrogenase family protein [Synechococcaceae cyanobacterium SM2_3_1]|nr:aldehyde dehydrogenase family protein [Synechococcaceae cyanobacterium SM2_3_1]